MKTKNNNQSAKEIFIQDILKVFYTYYNKGLSERIKRGIAEKKSLQNKK